MNDDFEAVARVRGVREQDSRLGLQQARREADEALARLDSLRALLAAPEVPGAQSLAAFMARRTALLAIGEATVLAEGALSTADTIAESALAHWQVDRTRLEAIEMLRDRRADERARECARAEAKELDEVATQLWARNHPHEAAS